MENDFIQLRRGIKEHIARGSLYFLDISTYTVLHLDADPRTGIIFTSIAVLASMYRGPVRWVRDSLDRLESGLYIRKFTNPGSHKPFPILINKYLCTFGARKGLYLNATETIDWRNPVYYGREEGARKALGRREEGARSEAQKLDNRDVASPYTLDFRSKTIELNPCAKTAQATLPPSGNAKPKKPKQTHFDRIFQRDRREAREAAVRAECQVGTGPEPTCLPRSLSDVDPSIAAGIANIAKGKKL